ncbi:aconitase iron-sulfur domain-containing protein [Rhizopogon salebrosus TDB-379]|nr:aconitase iron-sulfur domain-containing protein [Rhizopogon salebrosus TDB-379]
MFTITPGSEQVHLTIERDGQIGALKSSVVSFWLTRTGKTLRRARSTRVLITSYNRNFTGRNDASPATHAFVTSPDIVTAVAFAGDLTFNAVSDALMGSDGKPFKFSDPSGHELPPRGYDPGQDTFQHPPGDRASI